MPVADPEPPSASPSGARGRADAHAIGNRGAPSPVTLELLLETDDDVVDEGLPDHAFLHDWARRALEATLEGHAPFGRAELSVRLVGADTMRVLNRDWRGRDAPTNVLSFPSGLPVLRDDAGSSNGGLLALGDVALCPAVVHDEARAGNGAPAHHWAHLIVHGVLHLRGLDHENDGDAQVMEALETRLLVQRDLPDPHGERAGS